MRDVACVVPDSIRDPRFVHDSIRDLLGDTIQDLRNNDRVYAMTPEPPIGRASAAAA
jgi:hypothetical protein